MKKKFIFKKTFQSRNVVPIAVSFMMMPSFFFAQTEEQIKVIKKGSNLQALKALQKNFAKKTLSAQQLQVEAKKRGLVFSGESQGRYFQLKGFDKAGRPLYYITSNAGASLGTQTDKLNSTGGILNLDGQDMTVYEWDGGGVLVTHREFEGRVTQKDQALGSNSHATHVAGTMVAAGIDPKAKGMAPKAKLNAYDWDNDEVEMTAAATSGALVSNHSYGFVGGFVWGSYSGNTGWHWLGSDDDLEYKMYGKYTQNDRDWDMIAYNAPSYLPVRAAGNPRGDGPAPGGKHYVQVYDAATQKWEWKESTKQRQKNGGELGFDCINHGALGKNILIVGAAEKITNGYKQASDVKMASFSAFGPVDDGRIKPDIAGIGVDIHSTNSIDIADYTTMGGTSMASPNVTGSLLLLQEHYKNLNAGRFMKAATLRALAIGTANEAGEHLGPDYKSGWGLLNAFKAATAITTKDKYALISEKTLANNATETLEVVASGTEPLKVTIAWTDPVPKDLPNADELNQRFGTLVNDLDVRVKKNGVEYLPWKLDPANPNNAATQEDNKVDNVEQVVIESPEAGATYTIEIKHKGNLRKNTFSDNGGTIQVDLVPADSQDFSLVVTGINTGVNKDLAMKSVDVAVPQVEYSQNTPVNLVVENKGLQAITGGVVNYQLINVATGEVEFSGQENLENINAGSSQTKQVMLDLSKSFTEYKIVATVESNGDEIAINDKGEALVFGIVADITADEAKHSFGFEDSFIKNGWVVEDADGDGSTWEKYDSASLAQQGSSFAVNFPGFVGGSNDWIFSNPLKVKANTIYKLVFHTRKFQNFEEPLEVFMGNQPTSAAMTTPIGERILSPSGAYSKYQYEFTSPIDQTIYIGFNNKVAADKTSYAVALDEVTIQNAEGVPSVGFKTDKTQVNSYETVSLTSEVVTASTQPVSAYQWSFEPNDVTYVENTSATSQNPKVVLNKEGIYTVSLSATNVKGTATEMKENFITVKNTPVKAMFTNAISAIEEGEMITFTNASTGNPTPTIFNWTVTPSDGVEFTSNTTAESQNAVIKFNKYGTYTVTLKAKSLFNEDSTSTTINVSGIHEGVRDLKHTLENDKDLTLTWVKPNMKDVYFEGFESGTLPADVTVIDENNDKLTWKVVNNFKKSGSYSIEGKSWSVPTKAVNSNDWLILPKIRKGAEVLKFAVRNQYKERYDVYIVEAQESGQVPTLEEVKAGQKVFSFDATSTSASFKDIEVDIKPYTSKDFFVVFHQRTLKEDSGYTLYIDDIKIGYNNSIVSSGKISADTQSENVDYKALIEGGKTIVTEEILGTPGESQNSIIQEYGVLNTPYVTGYEVVKNGELIQNIDGFDITTYQETLSDNGTYTYDVYAVYSDGVKSDKKTVTVTIGTLSTNDVAKDSNLKVYPNPSDGRFVIEAKSNISSLKAEVYDMSGKLIFKNDFKGSKADLNLTQYPKGVYILNLLDNNGEKHSAKLMIK